MKKLIVSLSILVGLVVLATIPAAVFAQPHSAAHPAVPAVSPACPDTGLTGAQLQENLLFCNTGAVSTTSCPAGALVDDGIVYNAAIGAANRRVMVGSPTLCTGSVDWSGLSIGYVEFSSEFHAEFHGDNVVRIYDALNHQVYP